MESPVLLPLGVGDLVEVVGGAHIGRMGFVECVDDNEFISIIEIQDKMVSYFSLEVF